MFNIRKQFEVDEIDYVALKAALADYANPRMKIRQLLHDKILIRVKKGIYVFSKEHALGFISKEYLANIIYGPSCVSLEYALSYHGLIPERVDTVTSVTPAKQKDFDTPYGHFSYQYIHPGKFPIGVGLVQYNESKQVFMATPEKALADKIYFETDLLLDSQDDIQDYLFSNLRINEGGLKKLNVSSMRCIAAIYANENLTKTVEYLRSRK